MSEHHEAEQEQDDVESVDVGEQNLSKNPDHSNIAKDAHVHTPALPGGHGSENIVGAGEESGGADEDPKNDRCICFVDERVRFGDLSSCAVPMFDQEGVEGVFKQKLQKQQYDKDTFMAGINALNQNH